jgi:hypothetical protein
LKKFAVGRGTFTMASKFDTTIDTTIEPRKEKE